MPADGDGTSVARGQALSPATLSLVLTACLIGVALRLALIALTPASGTNAGDLLVYHQTALELTTGADAWLVPGSSFGYRSPLYFAYLAGVYSLTGDPTYHMGQLANLLLVAVLLVLLYRVTASAFGRRIAVIAVMLRALLPSFLVTDVFVLSEVLFDLFLLGAFRALQVWQGNQMRNSGLFWVGLFLGCAVLVREFAQGLVLILVLGFAFYPRARPAGWKRLSWALLGLALILTPWVARNTAVWGRITPLALTSGHNLHVGNHPEATGQFVSPRDPDHVPPNDLGFGTPEMSRWHFRRALRTIGDNPVAFLGLVPYRLGYLVFPRFLRSELVTWNLFPSLPRPVAIALSASSGLTLGALWILGIVGLVFRPLDGYGKMVLGVIAYIAGVVMASFGDPRFADPVLLLLIPFAAYSVTEGRTGWKAVSRRKLRTAVFSLTVLAGLWLLIVAEKLR